MPPLSSRESGQQPSWQTNFPHSPRLGRSPLSSPPPSRRSSSSGSCGGGGSATSPLALRIAEVLSGSGAIGQHPLRRRSGWRPHDDRPSPDDDGRCEDRAARQDDADYGGQLPPTPRAGVLRWDNLSPPGSQLHYSKRRPRGEGAGGGGGHQFR